MSFEDNHGSEDDEFSNGLVEGQMSIFELPSEPPPEEETISEQIVKGQLDLFSYYDNIKSQNSNNVILNAENRDFNNNSNVTNYANKHDEDKSYNKNRASNAQNLQNFLSDSDIPDEEKKQDKQRNENLDLTKPNEEQNGVRNKDAHDFKLRRTKNLEKYDKHVEKSQNYSLKKEANENILNDALNHEYNKSKQHLTGVDERVIFYKKMEHETSSKLYHYLDVQNNVNYEKKLTSNKNTISNKIQKRGREMASNNQANLKGNGGNGGGQNNGLVVQSIDEVLHNSMIPYSEFVLLDRALPRVEDGLKPVQRRILYTMLELGMTPDKAYRKCARIVGDCLGKYHPHGDTSVYDALVRMAQPFNMRGILVQGHGNFGSIDGDSAAAMRYTEAKLAPLAMELLRDLEKDTVKWNFNFDDTLKEPDTLPGRFPNLLVNGAIGIAVGLATNIPPHNLNEVIDGVIALIDHPTIQLKDMLKIIKGPDFPTGAIISTDELYQAYETGRGKITIRAKTHLEDAGNGKTNIVITEIPFQKNKASLLAKIVDIREDKKGLLLGIADIKDESDRNGIRAVITVKAGYNPNDILNLLYKYSDLQSSYGINMVAIADGKPKQLGLMDILKYYLNYQIDIVVRRTRFDLNNAKERMHILEGLHIAIVNIDEVVAIIKNSPNTTEAKIRLKQRFLLSERQAQAILDMRLARLTSLEVYKIEQEIAELKILIEKLTAILNSKRLQLDVIKNELLEIRRKYSMPRATKIVKSFGEIDVESILEANKVVEDTIVALTRSGTLKRMQPKHFDSTVKEFTTQMSENELHYNIIKTTTDQVLIAFTNKGNACRILVEDIKEAKWRDKGMPFRTVCKELDVDEKILAFFVMGARDNSELIFATKCGMLKRTTLDEYNVSKQKFVAIKLKEDDEVLSVFKADFKQTLFMVSEKGMALNCEINSVSVSGRVSQGVKGMSLADDDRFVFVGLMPLNADIVFVTKKGFGKRLNTGVIELSQRARKGTKVYALTNNDVIIFVDINNNNADYVIKYYGADNYIKKNIKEFFPSKKLDNGKSLSTNKDTMKITAVYKYNIE